MSGTGGAQPRVQDQREAPSRAPAGAAFAPIRRIGGQQGWYACDGLWRVRGILDLLVGGVGLRRGRRDPEHVAVGEALDFWRVQAYAPDRLLRLVAEMKVPGEAWLEFRVIPRGTGSVVRQTAVFHPRGWFGRLYWYALVPVHQLVFSLMLRRIVAAGEAGLPPGHGRLSVVPPAAGRDRADPMTAIDWNPGRPAS